MVTPSSVSLDNVANLKIFAQNIRGLGNKIDELVINWVNDPPHILCLNIIYQQTLFRVLLWIIIMWVHITVGNIPNVVGYVY